MNEDKIFKKLLEHDERFDRLESELRSVVKKSEDKILTAIDGLAQENITSKQE